MNGWSKAMGFSLCFRGSAGLPFLLLSAQEHPTILLARVTTKLVTAALVEQERQTMVGLPPPPRFPPASFSACVCQLWMGATAGSGVYLLGRSRVAGG
jgi:hypothetical protein